LTKEVIEITYKWGKWLEKLFDNFKQTADMIDNNFNPFIGGKYHGKLF